MNYESSYERVKGEMSKSIASAEVYAQDIDSVYYNNGSVRGIILAKPKFIIAQHGDYIFRIAKPDEGVSVLWSEGAKYVADNLVDGGKHQLAESSYPFSDAWLSFIYVLGMIERLYKDV